MDLQITNYGFIIYTNYGFIIYTQVRMTKLCIHKSGCTNYGFIIYTQVRMTKCTRKYSRDRPAAESATMAMGSYV